MPNTTARSGIARFGSFSPASVSTGHDVRCQVGEPRWSSAAFAHAHQLLLVFLVGKFFAQKAANLRADLLNVEPRTRIASTIGITLPGTIRMTNCA